ncbi:putative RNA-binding protein Luc7-like 1 [Nymphon striatum]|nr:putative RNA-binding protein Luc7-like 1 [Nymphon striatum]
MTAQEQMRAMLDQLMGTGRDGENNKFKVSFTDPKVCKSFLIGCCPHEILASTRMDLGECPKIHDLALRADFGAASKDKEYFYDVEAMDHLQNFINDCDKRTEQAKRRLAETQEELSSEAAVKANIVGELGEHIGKKLAKAEQMGAEGNVEESLKYMEEIEEIKKKKAIAEQELRNSMPASSYQQQKLRVCEVCSAYLGIHDNDRRLADHFGGKLHLGFITIREHLASLKVRISPGHHLFLLLLFQEQVQEKKDQNIIREIPEINSGATNTNYASISSENDNYNNRNDNRNRYNRDYEYRDVRSSGGRDRNGRRSSRYNNSDRNDRNDRNRRSRSRSHGHSSSRRNRSRSRERKRRSRSRSHSKRSHRSSSRDKDRDRKRRTHSSDED